MVADGNALCYQLASLPVAAVISIKEWAGTEQYRIALDLCASTIKMVVLSGVPMRGAVFKPILDNL